MKLAALCFQGSQSHAAALTALVNLDWGHNPDSSLISDEYLKLGCGIVQEIFEECRPRVVLTLANSPKKGRTWLYLSTHLSRYATGSIPKKPENLVVSLPGVPFSTLFLKSPVHPSLPATMQQKRLDSITTMIEHFLEQN